MKLLIIVLICLLMFGAGIGIGYELPTYFPPNTGSRILSLDETIAQSYIGAKIHSKFVEQDEDTRHNLYWKAVHRSAAYYLEQFKEEQ